MASLKEIRTRISSVSTTRQVTSAMKMVSAAKFRKAQDAIIQLRPYASKLFEILTNLSESLENTEDNLYAQQREIKKVLIIMITSNKGLCGAFNSNVSKKSISLVNEKYADQLQKGNVSFITIGKHGAKALKNRNFKIENTYDSLLEGKLTFDKVTPIAESIMQLFVNKEFDVIEIVYNQFKNAALQVLTNEQYLPVKIDIDKKVKSKKNNYLFEPSQEQIVKELIPKSLKIQFYKAIIDSIAAEHGARMTAMHKATDNATELLKDLRLNYNKARQASITNEILEIVGGAEALKG